MVMGVELQIFCKDTVCRLLHNRVYYPMKYYGHLYVCEKVDVVKQSPFKFKVGNTDVEVEFLDEKAIMDYE